MRPLTLRAAVISALLSVSTSALPQEPPPNYRKTIIALLRSELLDPRGVRDARISEPFVLKLLYGLTPVVCVSFNAKNQYGAYGGRSEYLVPFPPGQKVEIFPIRDGQCDNAKYSRFPEIERLNW